MLGAYKKLHKNRSLRVYFWFKSHWRAMFLSGVTRFGNLYADNWFVTLYDPYAQHFWYTYPNMQVLPVIWKTELNPIPNLPTLNGSVRLLLRFSFCILVQSSSVNTALLYANNAGPWNFASEGCSRLCWPCDLSSTKSFTSVAPASSAFCNISCWTVLSKWKNFISWNKY